MLIYLYVSLKNLHLQSQQCFYSFIFSGQTLKTKDDNYADKYASLCNPLMIADRLMEFTIQILCIGTDRSQQTVQTKIRLLLKKQSDQGLRYLPFHQHLLDALMQCYIKLLYFRTIMAIV